MTTDLVNALEAFVRDTVRRNYRGLGRVTRADLERRLAEYGRTLIDVPREALESAEVYTIEEGKEWAIDVDLWTKEEGRSDLTLCVTARRTRRGIDIEIDDLRVL